VTDPREVPAAISAERRWLIVVIAALLIPSGFLPLTDPVGAGALLVGALVQPRARRIGRWLMWLGAALVTFVTGTMSFVFVRSMEWKQPFQPPMKLVFYLAPVLVFVCDLQLIRDARLGQEVEPGTGRSLNWIVWIVTLALNVYYLRWIGPSLYAYQVYGRIDIVLNTAVFVSAMLVFDAALIRDALGD
jgi:hypothetical protein